MLDYSANLNNQGLVRFRTGAASYVTNDPGVYRILAVPYSYSDGDDPQAIMTTTTRYLHALDGAGMNVRDKLSAKLERKLESHKTYLRIEKKLSQVNTTGDKLLASVLTFASLFPPFYIGQAKNLRSRFRNHVTGNNSEVSTKLSRYDLSGHVVFFHWQVCPLEDLDGIESLLLQAYKPVFNGQWS